MNHGIVTLTEELRVLIETWRDVLINVTMSDTMRHSVERQLAREIGETHVALTFLRQRFSGGAVNSQLDLDAERIVAAITQGDAT